MFPTAHAGSSIIVVLLVLFLAVALVGTAVYFSNAQNRIAARQREVLECVAAADGALEYVYAVWRDVIRDAGTKAPTSKTLKDDQRIKDLKSGSAAKSPSAELAGTSNTFSNFTIAATDPWGVEGSDDQKLESYDVAVDDFPGWRGQAQFYKATLTSTGPKTLAGSKNVSATVSGISR